MSNESITTFVLLKVSELDSVASAIFEYTCTEQGNNFVMFTRRPLWDNNSGRDHWRISYLAFPMECAASDGGTTTFPTVKEYLDARRSCMTVVESLEQVQLIEGAIRDARGKLHHGLIQPNKPCPFMTSCEMHLICRRGSNPANSFSCGAARGFEILSKADEYGV